MFSTRYIFTKPRRKLYQQCCFSAGPRITRRQPRDKAKIKLAKQAKANQPKEKETPWPRSLQIAGYTAMVVSVPASFLTIVAEQPHVRDLMLGDRPYDETWAKAVIDFVRRYWSPDTGLFEGETERSLIEDRELSRLMDLEVPLNVVGLSGDGEAEYVEHRFQATMAATAQSIWNQIYPDDKVSKMEGKFAIEFGDIFEKDEIIEPIKVIDSFDESAVDNKDETDEDTKLFRMSQGVSGWQYVAPTAESSGGKVATGSSNRIEMSAEEIRISELEYNEVQLKMQMIDPYCTREIDEMEKELAAIRRELRSLKGSWRTWFS